MSDDEVLAEVMSRERQLLNPGIRQMGDRLEDLLHPDFIEFGRSGRAWDRTAIIAALASEPEVAGEATDFAAVRLASNVVHVTYRVVNGSESLRSSLWVTDSSGEWRLLFHQGTPLLA